MIRLYARFAREEPLDSFHQFYKSIMLIKDVHKTDSNSVRLYLYKVAIDKFSVINERSNNENHSIQ